MDTNKETSDPTQGSSNIANLNDNSESNSTDSLGGIFTKPMDTIPLSSDSAKTTLHICPVCRLGFCNPFELRYHIQLYFVNSVGKNAYAPAVIRPRPKYPDYEYLLLVRRLNSIELPTAGSSESSSNTGSNSADFCHMCGTSVIDYNAPSTSAAGASMANAANLYLRNFILPPATKETTEAGLSGVTTSSRNVDDDTYSVGASNNQPCSASSNGFSLQDPMALYWRNYLLSLCPLEMLNAEDARTSTTNTEENLDSVKSFEDNNPSSSSVSSEASSWSVSSVDAATIAFWKDFLPKKETKKKTLIRQDQLRDTKDDSDIGGSGNDEDCSQAGDSALYTSADNESRPRSTFGPSTSRSTAGEEPRLEARKTLTPVEEVDIPMSTTSVDRTRGTKRGFDVVVSDGISPGLQVFVPDASASIEKPLNVAKKRVVEQHSSPTSSSDSTCHASTSSSDSSSLRGISKLFENTKIEVEVEEKITTTAAMSQQEGPAPMEDIKISTSPDNDNSSAGSGDSGGSGASGGSSAIVSSSSAGSETTATSIPFDTTISSVSAGAAAGPGGSGGSGTSTSSRTSAVSLPLDPSTASTASVSSAKSAASAPERLFPHKRHFDISTDAEVIKCKLSKSDSGIAKSKKRPVRTFRRYSHIIYHFRMYNHKTPITCPRCQRVFANAFNFRLHRNRCH